MPEEEEKNTEAPSDPPEAGKIQPGSYYYDDATGYEVYDPAAAEDELDESLETGD